MSLEQTTETLEQEPVVEQTAPEPSETDVIRGQINEMFADDPTGFPDEPGDETDQTETTEIPAADDAVEEQPPVEEEPPAQVGGEELFAEAARLGIPLADVVALQDKPAALQAYMAGVRERAQYAGQAQPQPVQQQRLVNLRELTPEERENLDEGVSSLFDEQRTAIRQLEDVILREETRRQQLTHQQRISSFDEYVNSLAVPTLGKGTVSGGLTQAQAAARGELLDNAIGLQQLAQQRGQSLGDREAFERAARMLGYNQQTAAPEKPAAPKKPTLDRAGASLAQGTSTPRPGSYEDLMQQVKSFLDD